MKSLILIICFLLSITTAFGITDAEKSQMMLENVFPNGGAEQGLAGWNNNGAGAVTVDKTTKLSGKASIKFVPTQATDYLSTTAYAVKHFGNCDINFWYKAAVSTTAYVMQGANVINSVTLPANTAFQNADLTFVCVDSTTTYNLKIMGATSGNFYIDDFYQGKNLNPLGNVSQTQYYGGKSWTSSGGSFQNSVSGSTPGDFNTCAGCIGTTTLKGNAVADASNDGSLPQIKFNSLPAGTYVVTAMGYFGCYRGGSYAYCDYRFSDGTNTTTVQQNASSIGNATTTALSTNKITGVFTYTSAQAATTFKIQGSSAYSNASSTSLIDLEAGGALEISVIYYPPNITQVFSPNTSPAYWTGYYTSAASWQTSSTSYADPTTSGTPVLVESDNNNFGTVIIPTGNLPGVTFNPPHVGSYYICMSAVNYNTGGGKATMIALTDGTKILNSSYANQGTSNSVQMGATLCGIKKVSSLSPITVKLQMATSSGSTAWIDSQGITNQHYVDISIFDISQSFPMPQIVPNKIYAEYNTTSHQSIAYGAGTYTIENFDTKVQDSNNAVTTGANWKFVAPRADWYHVCASNGYGSNSVILWLYLFKNGVINKNIATELYTPNSNVNTSVAGCAGVYLNQGEYIDVRGMQLYSSGGASLSGSAVENWVTVSTSY
jgi:hypothetical protein